MDEKKSPNLLIIINSGFLTLIKNQIKPKLIISFKSTYQSY
jgi:hypothetical protein